MLPVHTCSACGICAKPDTFAEDVIDQRLETQSGQFQHRVLFVRNAPTPEEAKAGKLLVDPGIDWLLDYLAMSQFEWRVTAINKGYPGKQKDGKKDAKATVSQAGVCTDTFLVPLLKQFKPHVIVALGGEVLGHLWPKKRGEAPSIAKARVTPVQVAGMWLVSTYDPKMHGYWLQDDRKGSDLTEEYIRCFQQIHDLLDGTYRQAKVEWSMVDDLPGLQVLRDELDRLGVKRNYLDVEDDSWLGSKVRPHDIDPDGVLPEKLTIYHPNNRLLVIGITAVVADWITGKPTYKTYVILPGAWTPPGQDTGITDSSRTVLIAIFQGRDVECWNTRYDVACLLHFTDIDLRWHKLGDGFLAHGLPDQTKTGNRLKLVAQTRAHAPAWDIDLDQQKDMIAKRLRAEKIPPLVSMSMMPVEVYAPYNANDTYWNAVLVEEKLSHDMANNPDFPWVVYNMLLWGLPWLIEMERNGIPADEELFWDAITTAQTRAKKLWDAFRTIPEVRRAEQASGKEFNIRSPIFYEALVKELYGVTATEPPTLEEVAIGTMGYKLVIHVPPEFPRTDTGRLSSDKNTLQSMAGEVMGKVVPWEEKTRAQRLWTKVIEWRNLDDDATRLLGLFDYIVNDRIHSNFRILRSEVPGHEQGTQGGGETEGGTVSGRFSTSPNIQNSWPRMRMLLRTKPGKVWVKGDYGRIELAWLAWNSQDPLFMQWAREELDQHWARGGALWGRVTGNPVDAFKDQDKATQKAWRSKGKTQNFATVYLEEARTTASKTGATVEEVIQELMLADELHPGIRQLKMEVFELCQAGKLIKTCFGRCRSAEGWRRTKLTAEQWVSPDPLIHQGRDHHNMTIYRSLWNTRAAQGDSSDTAFYMGAHIYRKINSGYWLHPAKVKPISFEHDCLCWEVDEDYLDEALPALYNEMRDLSILPIKFDLPLPVDMKYGRTPLELEQEDYHKYTPAVVADSLKGWSPNDV